MPTPTSLSTKPLKPSTPGCSDHPYPSTRHEASNRLRASQATDAVHVCVAGRARRLPHALERRRPGDSHLQTGESGVREVTVATVADVAVAMSYHSRQYSDPKAKFSVAQTLRSGDAPRKVKVKDWPSIT